MKWRRVVCALLGHREAWESEPDLELPPRLAPCPRCGEPAESATTTPPLQLAYWYLCAGVTLGGRVLWRTWHWLRGRP